MEVRMDKMSSFGELLIARKQLLFQGFIKDYLRKGPLKLSAT